MEFSMEGGHKHFLRKTVVPRRPHTVRCFVCAKIRDLRGEPLSLQK